MNIAQRIKDLRLSKHLTQKELAQLLNVKPTTVSGWELGRNEPSIDTLKDLARIFGVSVDYMAGGQMAVKIKQKACKISTYRLLFMEMRGDNYIFIGFYSLFFLYIMQK